MIIENDKISHVGSLDGITIPENANVILDDHALGKILLIIRGLRRDEDTPILENGCHGGITIPENANVIDLEDRTVIPGFIDAHVHLLHYGQVEKDWLRRKI
jgi:imidazolonepropionase-like amidohydrolase